MVVRRLITIYLMWVLIGWGYFVCSIYYPILLYEPVISTQFRLFHKYFYKTISSKDNLELDHQFFVFIIPLFTTVVTFLLLGPVLFRYESSIIL